MRYTFICLFFISSCGGNPFLDDFKTSTLLFTRCEYNDAIIFMDSSLNYDEAKNKYTLEFQNQTFTLQLQKNYTPSPYLVKYESFNDLPTQEFVLYKTIINGATFDFKGYTCFE